MSGCWRIGLLDPAESLFSAAKLDITAGHAQAMTAAHD
jgi:hypothetical protein